MEILNKNYLPFHCRRRNQWPKGFTQIELIVVLGMIAALTITGMRVYSHFIDKARNTRAIGEIRVLEKEILEFWQTNDRLPDTLGELGRAAMQDPWKTPYQYINFDTTPDSEEKRRTKGNRGRGRGGGDPLNDDFDLFSNGKDRMTAPVLTDSSSKDDIIRANDGRYVGLAAEY